MMNVHYLHIPIPPGIHSLLDAEYPLSGDIGGGIYPYALFSVMILSRAFYASFIMVFNVWNE